MLEIISVFSTTFCKDTLRAFYRHPIEIALGIALAFLLTRALHNEQFEFLLQVGIAAPLVGLSAFAFSCLHAMKAVDRRARVGWTTLLVVFSLAYGLWFFADSRMVTSELWRWAFLVVGLGAAIMSIPLVAKGYSAPPGLRFWRFNARLAVRIFVCAIYLGLLFGGLRLGLGALDMFFEGALLWHDYTFDLGIWLFVGFGPWVVLTGSEAILDLDRPIPAAGIHWIARLGSFQIQRLNNAAEAAGILGDDKRIDMERFSETPRNERREIIEHVSYLRQNHGAATMTHLAPEGTEDIDSWAGGLWGYFEDQPIVVGSDELF